MMLMWRTFAGGVSVVVAGASGVVTALVTAHASWGLWTALGALVIVGAVLQMLAIGGERRGRRHVAASGIGAVAVGGSAGEIRTHIEESHGHIDSPTHSRSEVEAAGPGAVAVGGDAAGPISTEVIGPGSPVGP